MYNRESALSNSKSSPSSPRWFPTAAPTGGKIWYPSHPGELATSPGYRFVGHQTREAMYGKSHSCRTGYLAFLPEVSTCLARFAYRDSITAASPSAVPRQPGSLVASGIAAETIFAMRFGGILQLMLCGLCAVEKKDHFSAE